MKTTVDSLSTIIGNIEVPDEKWRKIAQAHLDSLTKPKGSLGQLEHLAARMVAVQESTRPSVERRAAYVLVADHGITEEGISAYPKEVTRQMVLNFANGGAAINVLARHANAQVVIVDVGVDGDLDSIDGIIRHKVRRGSRNMLHTPAMNETELESALRVGIDLAADAKHRELHLIAVGEMGIGNTTAASAITAALTGVPPAEVTGAGTGLSRAGVEHKKNIVTFALLKHGFVPGRASQDALSVLRCVGGLEIAAMTGLIITAARLRIATVIDGFISTAAAALAYSLQPRVSEYLFVGHQSEEPGHRVLLEWMGIKPLLRLEMRLGEGTGAVLAFHLIEAAVKLHNEMATFTSAQVSGAQP